MIARYSGRCKECGNMIIAGAHEVEKRGTKWVHVECPRSGAAVNAEDLLTPDEPAAPVAPETWVPSAYQQAVFDFVKNGTGHGVIEAVAGSGKTTTIVRALEYTPTTDSVGFVAFNKHIAEELKRRAPAHVHVSTLHSLGLSNMRGKARIEIDERKVELILDQLVEHYSELNIDRTETTQHERAEAYVLRNLIAKVVSLVKATLSPTDEASLESLCVRYGVDANGNAEKMYELVPMVIRANNEMIGRVDFDDMIYLPVVLNVPMRQFDWLFVDETQDMNASQIEFIMRSIKPGGRIIAVGDRWQSLYGFRGADTDAIPRMIEKLNATVLPLSITYRCPKTHVVEAKKLVEQIEAAPSAKEGSIIEMDAGHAIEQMRPGDMVICRINAPLVPLAFHMIRSGVKAQVRGRDIGQGLIQMVRRFKAETVGDFLIMMDEYRYRELERLSKRRYTEMLQQALEDKCDTLAAIAAECETIDAIEEYISSLFSDTVEGIVLSSVHRAKGLEAERVFLLMPELLPHPKAMQPWQKQQEMNAKYVAFTRAKDTLYLIHGNIE